MVTIGHQIRISKPKFVRISVGEFTTLFKEFPFDMVYTLSAFYVIQNLSHSVDTLSKVILSYLMVYNPWQYLFMAAKGLPLGPACFLSWMGPQADGYVTI